MIKFGKWIAKHKVIIVIISMLLLIPSFLGMAATRVNYDILSYLPESLETVEGQDIMVFRKYLLQDTGEVNPLEILLKYFSAVLYKKQYCL